MTRSERTEALVDLAWLAALLVLTRLPDLYLHYNDWDEAAMMSQAWAMTRGQVLYRDVAQIHPVLQFAVFLPFFAWLPAEAAPHAIKALNALLTIGGAWLLRGFVRNSTKDRDCGLAAGLLFIGLLGQRWATSSYGEFYTLFPALLSATLIVRQSVPWTAVGVLWGTAFFLKQTAVFDALGLAAGWLIQHRPSLGHTAAAAGRACAGALAVAVSVSVYFVSRGAFADAWRSMLLDPLLYRNAPGMTLVVKMVFFWKVLSPSLTAFVPCTLVAAVGLAARRTRASSGGPAPLPAAWLAAAIIGVWLTGKVYDHYLLTLVPPTCLLAGLYLADAATPWRRRTRLGLTVLLFALACRTFVPKIHALAAAGWTDRGVLGSTELAKAVRRHSIDGERIFLYGITNLDVFYLSDRLSSNGVYMYIDMEEGFLNHLDRIERQRLEMREAPPSVLVANLSTNQPYGRRPSPTAHAFFTDLIREHYDLKETISFVGVYRKR